MNKVGSSIELNQSRNLEASYPTYNLFVTATGSSRETSRRISVDDRYQVVIFAEISASPATLYKLLTNIT